MTATTAAAPVEARALKPKPAQVYLIARLTLETLGIDWPEDRKQAHAVIDRLKRHQQAQAASSATTDDIPF